MCIRDRYNIIKGLLEREDVDSVYVATDSGREGEYIFRLVENQIGIIKGNRKRVWIDSVSYTHLDVYKRQTYVKRSWRMQKNKKIA